MNLERCVLGTASLGGVWAPVDKKESVATILLALEAGISAIDTAPAYGDAEQLVGEALRTWKGKPPAISTKVGRLKSYDATKGSYDYSEQAICRSVENSLSTLGIAQLDVLFLHEPDQVPPQQAERIIRSLVSIRESGYAKKIGVGGNPPAWFLPFLYSDVFDVLMEYNTLNLCNTSALKNNLRQCLQKNIMYYAASPLHMGLLGDRFEAFADHPPSWLSRQSIETASCVNSVAVNHDMEMQELAHRFLLSLPYHFNIVIGAANRKQLQSTLAAFRNGVLPASLAQELLDCSTEKIA